MWFVILFSELFNGKLRSSVQLRNVIRTFLSIDGPFLFKSWVQLSLDAEDSLEKQ